MVISIPENGFILNNQKLYKMNQMIEKKSTSLIFLNKSQKLKSHHPNDYEKLIILNLNTFKLKDIF